MRASWAVGPELTHSAGGFQRNFVSWPRATSSTLIRTSVLRCLLHTWRPVYLRLHTMTRTALCSRRSSCGAGCGACGTRKGENPVRGEPLSDREASATGQVLGKDPGDDRRRTNFFIVSQERETKLRLTRTTWESVERLQAYGLIRRTDFSGRDSFTGRIASFRDKWHAGEVTTPRYALYRNGAGRPALRAMRHALLNPIVPAQPDPLGSGLAAAAVARS